MIRPTSEESVVGSSRFHAGLAMQRLEHFTLKCQIRRSRGSEVWSAVRDTDAREVILKRYVGRPDDHTRIRREFSILQDLEGPGVPRALDLVQASDGDWILVQEKVAGSSLAAWAGPSRVELADFLAVALQLTEVLARVHQTNLIHRDLQPENVVVESGTLTTHLLDFGLARPLGSSERDAASSSMRDCPAGRLAYTSPEQTGRMSRGIDFRSDLYSLGAVLYFALTGVPPFEGQDALALIHAHLARLPAPPSHKRADLPEPVSRIVLKLLEKEPDRRYQSAAGLICDLRACRDQLQSTGRISNDLIIGRSDARPVFSSRLYGRDRELEVLFSAYDRVKRGGTELVFLAGASGIGKSALVAELRRPALDAGGYLAAGKCDAYRRDVPYIAWASAIGSWLDQVLAEREERLAYWRARLRSTLGRVASALLPMVESLQIVLGDVAEAPPLGPMETRKRLALSVQRFLQAAAAAEHPLVVFLDDLQWADAGSLDLFETLLAQGDVSHLLIVAAYRTDGSEDPQPLASLIERLGSSPSRMTRIELSPLGPDAAAQMLSESLALPVASTRSLVEQVVRRTGTNPLGMQQFVLHMYQKQWLRFVEPDGWQWDEAAIAQAEVPESTIAFLISKLQGLDARERTVLDLSSCAGDEFDVDLLLQLSSEERQNLEPPLFALAEQGLIVPCRGGFRFAHDKIREAAQALIPGDQRVRLHRQMARHLLGTLTPEQRSARIFELVDHVNRAGVRATEAERLEAIELNRSAGERALASGAGGTALAYFSIARSLLREEDWTLRWEPCFELCLFASESAFQARDFDQALRTLDAIDQHDLSDFDFSRFAQKRIQVLAARESLEECLRWLLDALARVGVRWPSRPSPLRLLWSIGSVRWRLWRTDLENGLRPDPSPGQRRPACELIERGGSVLARINPPILVLGICWVLTRCLRHGYIRPPALNLASYACFIALRLWGPRPAERIAEIALSWRDHPHDPLCNARTELLIQGVLRPFVLRRRQAADPLRGIADRLRDLGDPEFALYAMLLYINQRMFAGDRIRKVLGDLEEIESWSRRAGQKNEDAVRYGSMLRMLEGTRSRPVAERDWAAHTADVDRWTTANSHGNETTARTLWMLVLCVHGRFDLCFAQSEQIWSRIDEEPYVFRVDHTLYRGIAAAALAESRVGRARRRCRRAVHTCHRKLRKWAAAGPDFEHMARFLSAELTWERGRSARAIGLYRESAQRALEHDFPHHAALALDRLAARLERSGRCVEAAMTRRMARAHYLRWGATARASELAKRPTFSQEMRADRSS